VRTKERYGRTLEHFTIVDPVLVVEQKGKGWKCKATRKQKSRLWGNNIRDLAQDSSED